MALDFNIVIRQIRNSYKLIYGNMQQANGWSAKECVNIFLYFYTQYKETFGEDHPFLRTATITRIVKALPALIDENGECVLEFTPDEYYLMIDNYFEQDLCCDYSIAHFMSGDIRLYRWEEVSENDEEG